MDDASNPPAVGAAAAHAWVLSDAGRAHEAAQKAGKQGWRAMTPDMRRKWDGKVKQMAADAARLAATNPRPVATPPGADAQPTEWQAEIVAEWDARCEEAELGAEPMDDSEREAWLEAWRDMRQSKALGVVREAIDNLRKGDDLSDESQDETLDAFAFTRDKHWRDEDRQELVYYLLCIVKGDAERERERERAARERERARALEPTLRRRMEERLAASAQLAVNLNAGQPVGAAAPAAGQKAPPAAQGVPPVAQGVPASSSSSAAEMLGAVVSAATNDRLAERVDTTLSLPDGTRLETSAPRSPSAAPPPPQAAPQPVAVAQHVTAAAPELPSLERLALDTLKAAGRVDEMAEAAERIASVQLRRHTWAMRHAEAMLAAEAAERAQATTDLAKSLLDAADADFKQANERIDLGGCCDPKLSSHTLRNREPSEGLACELLRERKDLYRKHSRARAAFEAALPNKVATAAAARAAEQAAPPPEEPERPWQVADPTDRRAVKEVLPELIASLVTSSSSDDGACARAACMLLEVLRSATVPIGLPTPEGRNFSEGSPAACLAEDRKQLARWLKSTCQPAFGFDDQFAVTACNRGMPSIRCLVRVWQLMMRTAEAALRNDLAELVLRLVATGGKPIRDVLFDSPTDFDASRLVMESMEVRRRNAWELAEYDCDNKRWVYPEHVNWDTNYPKGLDAFQMLARVYFVFASDELKARAFAKVAHVWPAGRRHSSYARDAYLKLVPVKLLGAFQQCPTRGLPSCTILAEVAAFCGHTHAEDNTAVLAALAARMQQYRSWNISGTDVTRLDRVIEFLYSPREGTLKAFPRALARLTAAPPPANALAVQPALAQPALAQPAGAQPAGAVPLLPPAPAPQPAAQPAAAVPLALPPPQLRPWERIMRRVDCAKCLAASDPGEGGEAARAAYGTREECGNGSTRDVGRMRACPLAEHALPRGEAEALLASHPEMGKRKLEAFMAAEFGVSAPLGKKPFAVPLYATAAAGGYDKVPGLSSGGAHKRVHMGFYIAGAANGEAGSSGGEAAGAGEADEDMNEVD